jgi:hypothetical protein
MWKPTGMMWKLEISYFIILPLSSHTYLLTLFPEFYCSIDLQITFLSADFQRSGGHRIGSIHCHSYAWILPTRERVNISSVDWRLHPITEHLSKNLKIMKLIQAHWITSRKIGFTKISLSTFFGGPATCNIVTQPLIGISRWYFQRERDSPWLTFTDLLARCKTLIKAHN